MRFALLCALVLLPLGCEVDEAASARDTAVDELASARDTAVDELALGGDEPRERPVYAGDRVHHLRLGFAMDILGETVTAAGPLAAALDELRRVGLLGPGQRPDLCINQVFRDGYHPCLTQGCAAPCGCANVDDPVIPVDQPACCNAPGYADQIRALKQDWNLLLTLSNLPYVSELAQYDPDDDGQCTRVDPVLCDPDQERDVDDDVTLPGIYDDETVCSLLGKRTWTSFPPVFDALELCAPSVFGDAAWRGYVTTLNDALAGPGGEVAYETGNEPEARRFFWGEAADFAAKSQAVYDAVQPQAGDVPAPRVFFGGYTGQTLSPHATHDPAAQANQDAFLALYDTYRDGGRAERHSPSFHIFRNVGHGIPPGGGPQEKPWASLQQTADQLDLSGGAISAFNLYGSADICATPWRSALMESDYFTYELAELLLFAHRNDLARIYFFKLLDFEHELSKLGFFDEQGAPKAAFRQVARVWQVIAGGYQAYELANPRRIRIVGKHEVFEAALAPLDHPGTASVLDCPDRSPGCLPEAPAHRAALCELYDTYDWHIYADDDAGRHCPGALVVAKSACAVGQTCSRRGCVEER